MKKTLLLVVMMLLLTSLSSAAINVYNYTQDDFNRSDGAPGTATNGYTWTTSGTITPVIENNRLKLTDNGSNAQAKLNLDKTMRLTTIYKRISFVYTKIAGPSESHILNGNSNGLIEIVYDGGNSIDYNAIHTNIASFGNETKLVTIDYVAGGNNLTLDNNESYGPYARKASGDAGYIQFINRAGNDTYHTYVDNITIHAIVEINTSVNINKPITSGKNVTINITRSQDYDSTWTSNQTKWYNGSTEITAFENLTTIIHTNFSLNETWTVVAITNDENNFTTTKNDSFTVGDGTPPIIHLVSAPSTTTTTQTQTITMNCSDNGNIQYAYVDFLDPNLERKGNFTMNLQDGLYTKQYVYSTVGTYTDYNFYCIDDNSNTAINESNNFSTTSVSENTGGGGGGGGSVLGCGLSIIQPTAKRNNPYCTPDGVDKSWRVFVKNNSTQTRNYNVEFLGNITGCKATPSQGSILGGAVESITISDCTCPNQDLSAQSYLVVKEDSCEDTLLVVLRGKNPAVPITVGLGVTLVVFIGAIIVGAMLT